MVEEIKNIMVSGEKYSNYYPIVVCRRNYPSRWEKMNIPMHCLDFALNPQFYDAKYLVAQAPGGVGSKSSKSR